MEESPLPFSPWLGPPLLCITFLIFCTTSPFIPNFLVSPTPLTASVPTHPSVRFTDTHTHTRIFCPFAFASPTPFLLSFVSWSRLHDSRFVSFRWMFLFRLETRRDEKGNGHDMIERITDCKRMVPSTRATQPE